MAKEIWRPGNMLYPLPVVMVSLADRDGKPNIITLAWVGTICSDPAMVSISVRPERYSHPILKETGEFVINLTTRKLVYATDYCGVKSGRDVDKFRDMHLTAVPASRISAPMIAESPVNIECVVKEVKELGSHDLFLAQVEAVHADQQYMDEKGRFCLEKAEPIVYSHGTYFGCGEQLGTFGYSVRKKTKQESGFRGV
ncbi:MAG: flavin reductase family protein [Lachnospiraceae bacterium]|nr:flavin reductase family protein [Lachnospiraceae bacterium]